MRGVRHVGLALAALARALATMRGVRHVGLALAVLLVVGTVVAWGRPLQDPPVVAAPTPTATPIGIPPTPTPAPLVPPPTGAPDFAAIAWHHSRALGLPFSHGRLVDGVQLPELGEDFFTWDPVFNQIPNRPWRR
jgi:hypothetical protein